MSHSNETRPTPIKLNRRKFLSCSAAAGLALSSGRGVEGAIASASGSCRIGLIGLGSRGTSLLRSLLELENARVVALCDSEPKHLARGGGIVEKSKGSRPESFTDYMRMLERDDIDAVVAALPCDLHAEVYTQAIRAGKHLYAEKPLGLTRAECDRVIAEAERSPDLVVRVGFQRRYNPRYIEGIELLQSGDLGALLEGRAAWVSSNGPVTGHDGWLARRERSGDWMVEQAVHVWDLFRRLMRRPPAFAFGTGRRDLFHAIDPARDVTDHYAAVVHWDQDFHLSFSHSWVDPADDSFTGVWQKVIGSNGGIDFGTGTATYRDRDRPRRSLHPGNIPDTKFALVSFLSAIAAGEVESPRESLIEARDATLIGLLVRKAVDERRVVSWNEIAEPRA